MNYRTARALYPNDPDSRVPVCIMEPLPLPDDHPELPLFEGRTQDPGSMEEVIEPVAPPSAAPPPPSPFTDPIPARMMNEFVYCQRLFFYEFVEGVFVESADTERGSALHDKVDRGRGALKKQKEKTQEVETQDTRLEGSGETQDGQTKDRGAEAAKAQAEEKEGNPKSAIQNPKSEGTIHSRSAMMNSERLGVVAKMDLIEVAVSMSPRDDLFSPVQTEVQRVTPVEYKAGAPREGADGNELWPADRMQLGLQMLILRDNGYTCDEGVLYYHGTRQRVRLGMTAELETWIMREIREARLVAGSRQIPPPLVASPKCVRCSLAPVCLPDETRCVAAKRPELQTPDSRLEGRSGTESVRRLIAARDDERALYLNTQGYRVGVKSERLVVKDGEKVVDEVRLLDVSHVALFGNIQLSTQAIQELCEQEIPVAYFSMGGWFYGLTRGHGLKNVYSRIQQFAMAADARRCLALARKVVQAKIKNHRTLLMRLHVEPPVEAVVGLKEIGGRTGDARSLEELLGMEGAAAALYFKHFSGMIKVGADDIEDEIPGLELPEDEKSKQKQSEAEAFSFDFTKRTRRPPTDPVNAMLSLAYSLLAKDCTIAALAVGFDPYVGFYHQPRHGRPALALDLMEEFRPLVAESAVLTAINNRMITPGHFVRAGDAVNLTPHGRKAFFNAYEQRMNALITHPVFDYKVSYRRVLELQARLLAKCLTGEIPEYIPMVTR